MFQRFAKVRRKFASSQQGGAPTDVSKLSHKIPIPSRSSGANRRHGGLWW